MKRPAWRPRLKLVQGHFGAYWRVYWTWDRDVPIEGGYVLHPPHRVPYMTRCSAPAHAAHNFVSKLNEQR